MDKEMQRILRAFDGKQNASDRASASTSGEAQAIKNLLESLDNITVKPSVNTSQEVQVGGKTVATAKDQATANNLKQSIENGELDFDDDNLMEDEVTFKEGDQVMVTGDVEMSGCNGTVVEVRGGFVVVDIDGENHSFHSSDLTFADDIDHDDLDHDDTDVLSQEGEVDDTDNDVPWDQDENLMETWQRKFEMYLNEEKKKDPCWDGYHQLGMKTKDGKKVPNCIPDKSVDEACSDDTVNESLNVNLSSGYEDPTTGQTAGPTISISGTDEDATSLMALLKSAGIGPFAGEAQEEVGSAYGLPTDANNAQQSEVNSEDQGYGAMTKFIGVFGTEGNEDCEGEECDDSSDQTVSDSDSHENEEDSKPEEAEQDDQQSSSEDEDEGKEQKVDEGYANEPDTSEASVDFMVNGMAGGINRPKQSQAVGNPVRVDMISELKRLSGIK